MLFLTYLTCLWEPLETFPASPQLTSRSMKVGAAALQPELSPFFA